MIGLGLHVFKNITSESSEYLWNDPHAEAYYNKVTLENGGDINTVALYSVDLDTYKGIIDTLVIGSKSGGIWSELSRYFPFTGGTALTHAINIKNATSELLYINAPVHNATGMILTGTEYASMNNNPSVDMDPTSAHMGMKGAFSGTVIAMGSRFNSSPNASYFRYVAGVYRGVFNGINMDTTIAPPLIKHTLLNRDAFNSVKAYEIGIEIASNTIASGGTQSTIPTFIGAYNNLGSPANLTTGAVNTAHLGTSLTPSQITTFNTLITNFNTALGR